MNYCDNCKIEISKKAKMCVSCNNKRPRDYTNIVEKRKNTMISKYGVSNPMFDEVFKDKIKNTNIEKYGVENVFQNSDIKNKIKESNVERHGVEYPSQSSLIREKMITSCIENYGVTHPSKSEEVKIRKSITCLKNYGVENPAQSEEIMNKILLSRGFNRSYDISEFNDYQYKVVRLTSKNRKELLENWDGYDYYDNEYILENYNLSPNDKLYPTIDHKKSIFYCFGNDISIYDASDITNLCITKRYINSRKNRKNEDDFNNLL